MTNRFNKINWIIFRGLLIVLTISTITPLYLRMPVIARVNSEEMIDKQAEDLIKNKKFDANSVLIVRKQKSESKGSDSYSISKLDQNNRIDLVPVSSDKYFKLAQSDSEKQKVKNKIKELLKDPTVKSATPNYYYESFAWNPTDYDSSYHWYYEKENLPNAWGKQLCPGGADCGGSSNVTVAVIDTGLAFESFTGFVTEYEEQIIDGETQLVLVEKTASFVGSPEYSGINLYVNPGEIANNGLDDDCNGAVDDVNGVDTHAMNHLGTSTCSGGTPIAVSDDFKKVGHPVDTYGHGSLVTGLIASTLNNGGSVSPAHNVTLMPIAANTHFTRGFSVASLISAVSYAQTHGADIINMSLGGTDYDPPLKAQIDSAYNSGVMVVAASGNYGTSTQIYPAAYENVIAVGAVNSNNTRCGDSSHGHWIDMVAYVGQGPYNPGSAIWQTTLSCYSSCNSSNINSGTTEKYSTGTSFASPQVASVLAFIKTKYPTLSNSQMKNQLINSLTDIGSVGFDNDTGWGVIDFDRAISTLNTSAGYMELLAVYRFYSQRNQIHFYTSSNEERDWLINSFDDYTWKYEEITYYAYPLSNCSGRTPLYRFYSQKNTVHFYTNSTEERDWLINTFDDYTWRYEGQTFCVSPTSQANTIPVYRFYSQRNQAHFYTTNSVERDWIINTFDDYTWRYEGIAFYAYRR